MKNLAILSVLLSFFLISCGDDSSSSADDLNEESGLSSSSSSKANKDSKPSSSSSVKSNKSSKSSSSSSEKANNNSKSSSSSSEKNEKVTKGIQDWKDTTEGTLRKSDISDTIYIFDNKKWRIATLPEASLGACNEKNVGNFGYADSRKKQDLSYLECVNSPEDGYCFRVVYNPGYYICKETGPKRNPSWEWKPIRFPEYTSICDNPSDDANSKKNNAYWGNFTPVREKCINCNQESIDHFEDQCKKRCYMSGKIAHASACVLGLGCVDDLYGTIKEGPSLELASDTIFYEDEYNDEHLYHLSYPISIDSTKKTKYICRHYREFGDLYGGWKVATDIDIDLAPTICTYGKGGSGFQILTGTSGTKYVCDNGKTRLATQEEIEEWNRLRGL